MNKLLNIQKKIGKITKDKTNPFFKSSYFDINSLLDQLLPLLHEEGLLLTQPLTTVGKEKRPALATIITDTEDDKILINSSIVLPDLTDPQKMGSIITYYRRYALQSLFALQAEDDDGNKGAEKEKKDIQLDEEVINDPTDRDDF